ncbi:arf-GAP with Rho-GAP domain, ANK repeat and PH domain-containing protein 2 [Plodia interpunctella]|uniref:arf-GAP with Rho-GAP domain, ANK repeat and PH domain-containing protein 2 n=1 Tax=Plodia interpunctella TaxID=58824 RepID=UPI0023678BBE|nr:arf-GAP with Rho-GAP domain, ANK repeat and PH domain-containing protein 2 [Plodia interpunctella]
MDNPPVPKPRSVLPAQIDSTTKQPVPLPRTKVPTTEKSRSTAILRSFSSVSKITGDVANKVASSAKTAKTDSSKFAKETLERTLQSSRAVFDGTKSSLKLRRHKRLDGDENLAEKHMSMPCVDVSLFENIQFHSPMLELKKYRKQDGHIENPSLALNKTQFDDISIFSNNSDSNTESMSDFSRDSIEFEHNPNMIESDQMTYDTPRQSRTNSMISETVEIPERRTKRASEVSFMRNNSMYENWTLPCSKAPKESTQEVNTEIIDERPSKSTIFEFDPLNTSSSRKYDGVSNELLLLESFLIGDTYGSIISNDGHEDHFEFMESEHFNPPTPPERSDSLFPDIEPVLMEPVVKDGNKPLCNDTKKTPKSVMHKFTQILKLDSKLNKVNKQEGVDVKTVERPPINQLQVPYYCGTLTRVGSAVGEEIFKNSQSRYCVLSEQKFMCYTDPTKSVLKEAYTLDNIHSVQLVLPISTSTTANSFCFELLVSSGNSRQARKIVFSSETAALRRTWTHHFAAHLTSFPNKYTLDFTRCGWCYLKEGVTGEWQGTWMILHRRVLAYYVGQDTNVCNVDLRKARCVATQEADDDTKSTCQSDCGDNLLLDCPDTTLYLHFPHERELKSWRFMARLAAHNNGSHLYHQQLTKEDVPVVVDKCLSFVYAHGSLSEGIYRRAGSNLMISDILTRFRRDAWAVQLTHGVQTEHDVAGALKRFFRELPEPLIPKDKHQEMLDAQALEPAERYELYRRIMTSLPLVAANTARRLFAHLHFIQSMMYANKMSAENLAAIWVPTVTPAAMTTDPLQNDWNAYLVVVKDLIANFESIWEPTEAEKRREAAIRRVLVKVYGPPTQVAPKAAGDLRTWIYVHDRNTCHQIALTPSKTCSDICIELCEKAGTYSHLLMLEEIVCENSMRRIIHKDEILLDVVLRWGYWDEEHIKDNYLLLSENTVLQQIDNLKGSVGAISGMLKFANETTKTYKSHMFGIQDGSLCYFKDKQVTQKVEEWKIKDHLWFMGHELKANPHAQWSITFVPKNNKPKRKEKFGCTIAGAVADYQLKWIAALMVAEHADLLPTPRLIDT